MFLCQFFNENPDFGVTSLTKVMSRVKVNNENGNPRDQDRELLCSFYPNMHVIHVYMEFFEWESEFHGYIGDKGHVEGPGEQ